MNSNNEFEVARLQTKKIGQVAWPFIDKKILFSQRMALQKKNSHIISSYKCVKNKNGKLVLKIILYDCLTSLSLISYNIGR